MHSVLGPRQLLIRNATVSEQLGCLTSIDLELLSPDEAIDLDKLLGRGISVELALDGDRDTVFSRAGRRIFTNRQSRQLCELFGPRRALAVVADTHQRLPDFSAKKRSRYLEVCFRDSGTSDFDVALSGTYQPRDYCVQYMETDFNS